ncbi:response regulator [Tellurirhabdus rosea]|uniref:response regulator n=1 Tax=Tellurirhabdus rosea TaxID=2674997 RepID=UPI002250F2C1|nr:response regulator [Tellurirhabdus rosea]
MDLLKQPYKIFLVDDDEDDCFLTSKVMSNLAPCVDVDCIYRGDKMLQRLEVCDPADYPRLILLDLNMPILSGFEVLVRLKQHRLWRAIPVVIFTTSSDKRDEARSYELGANLFLTKPSQLKEMEALFYRYKDAMRSPVQN